MLASCGHDTYSCFGPEAVQDLKENLKSNKIFYDEVYTENQENFAPEKDPAVIDADTKMHKAEDLATKLLKECEALPDDGEGNCEVNGYFTSAMLSKLSGYEFMDHSKPQDDPLITLEEQFQEFAHNAHTALPGADGYKVSARAKFMKQRKPDIENKIKLTIANYNSLTDIAKNKANKSWADNSKATEYSIADIITVEINDKTQKHTCKAKVTFDVKDWGAKSKPISYSVERTSEDQISTEIFGLNDEDQKAPAENTDI